MEKPYLGVTGLTTVDQVKSTCSDFRRFHSLIRSSHLSMAGFLVSYKTLNGEEGSKRYPKVKDLRELLEAAGEEIFTTIHYNSREDHLADQVSRVFDGIYQDNLCKGLQLNISWPNSRQVSKIKHKFPGMKIIFQVSHKAMSGYNSRTLARNVRDKYGNDLSYALIDPSGGREQRFEIDSSFEVYGELRDRCPELTVGFAGGLTGSIVRDRVNRLTKKIGNTNFSIDAEGGLRDGKDELNPDKVRNYIMSSALAFSD